MPLISPGNFGVFKDGMLVAGFLVTLLIIVEEDGLFIVASLFEVLGPVGAVLSTVEGLFGAPIEGLFGAPVEGLFMGPVEGLLVEVIGISNVISSFNVVSFSDAATSAGDVASVDVLDSTNVCFAKVTESATVVAPLVDLVGLAELPVFF